MKPSDWLSSVLNLSRYRICEKRAYSWSMNKFDDNLRSGFVGLNLQTRNQPSSSLKPTHISERRPSQASYFMRNKKLHNHKVSFRKSNNARSYFLSTGSPISAKSGRCTCNKRKIWLVYCTISWKWPTFFFDKKT